MNIEFTTEEIRDICAYAATHDLDSTSPNIRTFKAKATLVTELVESGKRVTALIVP